jgi:hypothetical protein
MSVGKVNEIGAVHVLVLDELVVAVSPGRDEIPRAILSRGTIRPFARITEVRVRASAAPTVVSRFGTGTMTTRGEWVRMVRTGTRQRKRALLRARVRRDKMIALIVLEN